MGESSAWLAPIIWKIPKKSKAQLVWNCDQRVAQNVKQIAAICGSHEALRSSLWDSNAFRRRDGGDVSNILHFVPKISGFNHGFIVHPIWPYMRAICFSYLFV